MKNNFYVYILYRDIKCLDPFYVGKGSGKRYSTHERGRHRDDNPVKKEILNTCVDCYGFVPYRIVSANVTSFEALCIEAHWIKFFGRLNTGTGRLTNRNDGGGGCYPRVVNSETRAKISAVTKAQWADPVMRERFLKSREGIVKKKRKPVSEEGRKNIGAASKGRKWSPEHRAKMEGRIPSNKGKKWPEKQYAAFSAGRRGIPSIRKGVPSGRKGIPMSEAAKAKLSASQRARHARRRAENG